MTAARLVLAPCHAVFVEGRAVGPFPDEAPYCLEHARAGVELASAAVDALLIFSGGATQGAAGLRTEALSYVEEARRHGWWGHPQVESRTATEEYARDSRENLLFSLERFFQLAGRPPESVTVIGWQFKERRFHLHCESAGWPAERFRYIGVNNPPPPALEQALAGEEALVRAVLADPRMEGPEFAAKRALRDPFGRGPLPGFHGRLPRAAQGCGGAADALQPGEADGGSGGPG